jgi:hypothetical protein
MYICIYIGHVNKQECWFDYLVGVRIRQVTDRYLSNTHKLSYTCTGILGIGKKNHQIK